MAGMILMPTQNGLKQLKEHTKDALQKIELLDKSKKKFWEANIFTAFYDENKVLTALFDIPLGVNLTTSAYYINVVANGQIIATGSLTAPIAFVEGVGGIQTLKFPIAGEAGEIIFKNNNFISEVEFEERYISSVIDVFALVKVIEKYIYEKEIKEIDEKEKEKKALEEFEKSILDNVRSLTENNSGKLQKLSDDVQNRLSGIGALIDKGNIAFGSTDDTNIRRGNLQKGKYLIFTEIGRGDGADVDDVSLNIYIKTSGDRATLNPALGENGVRRIMATGVAYVNIVEDSAYYEINLLTDGGTKFNGTVNFMIIKIG